MDNFKLIGGHITFDNAFETNRPTQIYITPNRMHIYPRAMDIAKQKHKKFDAGKLITAHAPYVTHPWSNNPDITIKGLEDIKRLSQLCNYFNIPFLLAHLPNGVKSISKFSLIAKEISKAVESPCCMLFENVAAPFGKIDTHVMNTDPLQLICEYNDIFSTVFKKESYGFCIDTAHLFSSGVAITTIKDVKNLVTTLKNVPIKWCHLNGNSNTFNTKRDRHVPPADYGDYIWGDDSSGLCYWVNWLKRNNIPSVIETPGNEKILQYFDSFELIQKKCIAFK